MSLYRVLLESDSFAVLPMMSIMEVKSPAGEPLLHFRTKNRNAVSLLARPFADGLEWVCDVEESGLDSACAKAYSMVEQMLDSFCFMTGAIVGHTKVKLAYDVTPGIYDREFLQLFPNTVDRIGSRTIPLNVFDALGRRIAELVDPGQKDRIQRALHWYRHAIRASEPFDKFTYTWTGLETLEPLLRAKLNPTPEYSRCLACGDKRENSGATVGVKEVMSLHMPLGAKTYSKARRLRNGLLHGFEPLHDLVPAIEELADDMVLALQYSLLFLLDMSQVADLKIGNPDDPESVELLLTCKLVNLPIALDDPAGLIPRFEVRVEMKDNGSGIVFSPVFSANFLDHGVGIRDIAWALNRDFGYTIRWGNTTVIG